MSKAYQYDADGYYAGDVECQGLLPNNATDTAPARQDGYIPRWNGTTWEQTENHTGEEGYVNGTPHTIKEYGPYPQGWSINPPLPGWNDALATVRSALRAKRKKQEYGGFPLDGQIWGSAEKDELRLHSACKFFEHGNSSYEGWKINDSTYITLTPELLSRALAALMQHHADAFAMEAAKLAELDTMNEAAMTAMATAETQDERETAQAAAVTDLLAWADTVLAASQQ